MSGTSMAAYSHKRARQIVTPEGISLPVTVASRGARVGALLLDFTFIYLTMLAIFIILMITLGGLIGVALPLYLVTMAGQNLPGAGILVSHGYEPHVR